MIPVSPPIRNSSRNPIANSIAAESTIAPADHRPDQREVLEPRRNDQHRRSRARSTRCSRRPVANMWCAQTDIDSAANSRIENVEALVAEEPAARERRRSTSADHPDEREEHHVDDGVAVEPEQQLVGDRPVVPVEDAAMQPVQLEQPPSSRAAPGTTSARAGRSRASTSMNGESRTIVIPGARLRRIVASSVAALDRVPEHREEDAADPEVLALPGELAEFESG